MATYPIIQTNGSIAGIGTAGRGREDFAIGEVIDFTQTVSENIGEPHKWVLRDAPTTSALTALVDDETELAQLTLDATGSYHVTLTIGGSYAASIIIAVLTPNLLSRIPALSEGVGDYNKANNLKSWHPALSQFMRAVDALLGGGGALLNAVQEFTKNQRSHVVPLTDGANVSYAAEDSNIFELQATDISTRQLNNPTLMVKGMEWQVWFHQSAGGEGMTYGSWYDFQDEGAPDFTGQGANVTNIISCVAITSTQIFCTTLKGGA